MLLISRVNVLGFPFHSLNLFICLIVRLKTSIHTHYNKVALDFSFVQILIKSVPLEGSFSSLLCILPM